MGMNYLMYLQQMLDFDYSRICGYFGCSKLENNGFCFIQIPWEGTTCGNGKVSSSP